ncbi:MAG: HAD-IA family hydrolase [Pseudomonadota bacterium]|nr:HAD-IA family hydrolase [Pseudomonadota bacterium]
MAILQHMPSHPAQLIIFDCDGVLLDSEIIAARAHAKAFHRAGILISETELVRRLTGITDPEMYRILESENGTTLPDGNDEDVKSDLERDFREELRAVDGVHQMLAGITLPACVASSSSPSKLKLGLTQVGLYGRFAPHIFSASAVARGKPAPDVFIYAAQQMQTDPSTCWVVEDSVAGVRAGIAAA